VQRFLNVARKGVSAQGVHMEGAPAYHVYFLGMTAGYVQYLLRVLPAAESRSLQDLPSLLAPSTESLQFARPPAELTETILGGATWN